MDSKRLSILYWPWEIISKKLYFESLGKENKKNLNVPYAGIFASAYFEYVPRLTKLLAVVT